MRVGTDSSGRDAGMPESLLHSIPLATLQALLRATCALAAHALCGRSLSGRDAKPASSPLQRRKFHADPVQLPVLLLALPHVALGGDAGANLVALQLQLAPGDRSSRRGPRRPAR